MTSINSTRIAIVGPSNKKLSTKQLDFVAMTIKSYVSKLEIPTRKIILVSGGGAWIEHVAVQLYLTNKFEGLELYLPCSFDLDEKKFDSSAAGQFLNKQHSVCSRKTGVDVFDQLHQVACDDYVGFEVYIDKSDRLSQIIANTDHLLAFTFGDGIQKTEVKSPEKVVPTTCDDGQRPSEKKSTPGDFYDDGRMSMRPSEKVVPTTCDDGRMSMRPSEKVVGTTFSDIHDLWTKASHLTRVCFNLATVETTLIIYKLPRSKNKRANNVSTSQHMAPINRLRTISLYKTLENMN
jgi:hypothetical protein